MHGQRDEALRVSRLESGAAYRCCRTWRRCRRSSQGSRPRGWSGRSTARRRTPRRRGPLLPLATPQQSNHYLCECMRGGRAFLGLGLACGEHANTSEIERPEQRAAICPVLASFAAASVSGGPAHGVSPWPHGRARRRAELSGGTWCAASVGLCGRRAPGETSDIPRRPQRRPQPVLQRCAAAPRSWAHPLQSFLPQPAALRRGHRTRAATSCAQARLSVAGHGPMLCRALR